MHYKNNRLVTIGDWVVGKTHNSDHKIIVGIVLETMPKQGTCNVRLHVFRSFDFREKKPTDDGHGEVVAVGGAADQKSFWLEGRSDYADAAELIHVMDGFRMVEAVIGSGNWDAPYFPPTFG